MTTRRFSLTAAVATLSFVSSLKAQSTGIDRGYLGYEILEIYSSRRMIERFFTGVKPLSRERFGFLLLQPEREIGLTDDNTEEMSAALLTLSDTGSRSPRVSG